MSAVSARRVAIVGSHLSSAPAAAEDEPFVPEPALNGGLVIPLWPAGSPKLNQQRVHEAEVYTYANPRGKVGGAQNIHNPSLEAHPLPASASGACAILVPGGGHVSIGVSGGTDQVAFFQGCGVSTVIVRPRLRGVPDAGLDDYNMTTDAVWDTQQAIRIVRSHAKEWGIDPKKIGVVGFSAGAELVAASALEYDAFDEKHRDPNDPLAGVSSRPDFIGLLYPGPTPFETMDSRRLAGPQHDQFENMGSRLHGISPLVAAQPPPVTPRIPDDVPPSFAASSGIGDLIHALWATEWFTAMLKAGVPNTEMHIYASGTHGGAPHTIPFSTWKARFIEWLDDLGFLGPMGAETRAAADVAAFQRGERQNGVPGQVR
jgi:endo-1,4-beta-xylanase